ncbi:MAG: DUF1214 domain-containing protein [Pseudomonadota bacterium]
MIRSALTYTLATILGVALGSASAVYLAGLWPGSKPLDFGDIEVDGWRSDFAIGSDAADAYTRARVARHGLLALAKSEAVYFTRTTDSAGAPLREDCTYRLSVGKMPAKWWSVTLYNGESYLPDNMDEALSVNANQDIVAQIGDAIVGRGLRAIISAERPDEGTLWISSRNAGNFDLTLRLYVPDDALLDDPEATLPPPEVTRLSCAGDTP